MDKLDDNPPSYEEFMNSQPQHAQQIHPIQSDLLQSLNYIKIRKFDPTLIRNPQFCNRVLIIGKSSTGKTTLVENLLGDNSNVVCMTSAQEDISRYSKIIPTDRIYKEYNPEIIENLIKNQNAKRDKKLPNQPIERSRLIIDNCLYDNKWTKDKSMKDIFFNGRFCGIQLILTMQFSLGIPPAFRANVDFVFILRENIISNRERIYKQYAGMFPSFDVFCRVMDQCTEDYECLVIHNASKSNRFEDQVFWYKANDKVKLDKESQEYNFDDDILV